MYIVDHNQQVQLIKEMTQLRRDLNCYEVYYHHPHTNQMWKSFFPVASNEDLGQKLLRHEPLPDNLGELLKICLVEEAPENAIGLGIEMSTLIDEWPIIFDLLDKNYSSYDRKQLRLFLKHLCVEKYHERIEDVENIEILNLTEKDLKKLAWRSRKLKVKSLFI